MGLGLGVSGPGLRDYGGSIGFRVLCSLGFRGLESRVEGLFLYFNKDSWCFSGLIKECRTTRRVIASPSKDDPLIDMGRAIKGASVGGCVSAGCFSFGFGMSVSDYMIIIIIVILIIIISIIIFIIIVIIIVIIIIITMIIIIFYCYYGI